MALVVRNPPANIGDIRDTGLVPELGRVPWSRKWQPTPVVLHGESHGQRSLLIDSALGCQELEMTEVT